MRTLIDIDDDLYTRLFDNGIEDYEIVNDDLFAIAKSIRKGTPLEKHDEEVIKETVESIWGTPPYTELLDKIRAEIVHLHDWAFSREEVLRIIDKYRAESEEGYGNI